MKKFPCLCCGTALTQRRNKKVWRMCVKCRIKEWFRDWARYVSMGRRQW